MQILNLTPTGQYADGSPRYSFSTSYPTKGVHMIGQVVSTPELAYSQGKDLLREWLTKNPYSNLGELLGVAASQGGFQAVVNTYRSNT